MVVVHGGTVRLESRSTVCPSLSVKDISIFGKVQLKKLRRFPQYYVVISGLITKNHRQINL